MPLIPWLSLSSVSHQKLIVHSQAHSRIWHLVCPLFQASIHFSLLSHSVMLCVCYILPKFIPLSLLDHILFHVHTSSEIALLNHMCTYLYQFPADLTGKNSFIQLIIKWTRMFNNTALLWGKLYNQLLMYVISHRLRLVFLHALYCH